MDIYKRKYKPWWSENDANDVHFSSIQLYAGDNFYPCSGSDEIEVSSSLGASGGKGASNNVVNIGLTSISGNSNSKSLSQKKRREYCDQASNEFRTKISSMLLPSLRAFKPDLVFISAGFDGHVDDKYHYLTEEDYHWVTEALCNVAELNNAPVISILEGGYSLSSPTSSSSAGIGIVGGGKLPTLEHQAPFATMAGDGGLVKGVLAHTAALANLSSWL